MNLTDKVAIITGSSRGFGAKIAKTLRKYGADVVITYLEGDNIEKHNAECVGKDTYAKLVLPLDVTHRESIINVFKKVKYEYGRVDILVNNAGINFPADFDKQTEEEWDAVMDVDLKGVFFCCQEVLPYITDDGRIINIGSVSGEYGGPRTPSYACAKAGVMALTHNVAIFLGNRGITVNCVSPGMIESDMLDQTMPQSLQAELFPQVLLKRQGKVNEVSETVAFLASESAGYITGQTISVNGGLFVR